MKKYKQFFVGVIVGAMLFSVVPISAAIEEFICYRADYKVVVNGAEYSDADLPILNYKGNTYAPFRSILEKAGLNVTWNADLNQAEVTSNPTSSQINDVEETTMSTTAITIEYNPVTGLPVGAEYIDNEKDGIAYKTISFNGKTYISESDLKRLYHIAYVTKGTFVNNDTKETYTVDFSYDTFTVKAVVYTDLSIFKLSIGE